MSHQAGKCLSGWTASFGDTIVGGQPPTFEDVTTEMEPLERFTEFLFAGDTTRRWKSKVREMLVMSLFLRYDQFCDILLADPTKQTLSHDNDDGLYGPKDEPACLRNNVFLCRIHQALEMADAEDWLPEWKEKTRNAFISRNAPALPIQTFQLYGVKPDEGITMDPRTFTDHYNMLASVAQSNHAELQRQRHALNDAQSALAKQKAITTSVVSELSDMKRILRRLETHLIGEEVPMKTTSQPKKGVIRFSVLVKQLPRSPSLVDIAFFVDNYRSAYELDKNNPLPDSNKAQLRKKFSKFKRAVKVMLFHADSYPLIPQDDPSLYKEVVRRVATSAYECLQAVLHEKEKDRMQSVLGEMNASASVDYILKDKKKKVLTVDRLENFLADYRDIENEGKFPDNTPGDSQRFFANTN
jgi:hypothetical protein